MASSAARTDTTDPDDLKSLFESQTSHRYEGRIGKVIDMLKQKFPDVEPVVFNYKPQISRENRARGAWGKVAVSHLHTVRMFNADHQSQISYSPNHSGSSIWQVYLQGKKYEEIFPNVELQIWRINENVNEDIELSATNVIRQVKAGDTIDPCNGGLDGPFSSSEIVKQGSVSLDVIEGIEGHGPAKTFNINDASGKAIYTGCQFFGTGTYRPIGEGSVTSPGYIAGTLTCKGGMSRVCSRPLRDNFATTCGGKKLSECGELGKGCAPYWVQAAICRI